ncbi:MAG: flagellar basal body-associated FliL family protein [Pseudomonadota bacterium]
MAEPAEDTAAEQPKGKSKTKLVLVAVVALLLLGGGGTAVFVLAPFGGAEDEATSAEGAAAQNPAHGEAGSDGHGPDHGDGLGGPVAPAPLFVDLPQMLVNLAVGDGRPRFLKLSISVEVGDEAVAERVGQLSPRIVDSFQMYLRTLTPAELQSPGAMFRLKEDLHVRIHQAIEPQRVADVLFKEMLVQ